MNKMVASLALLAFALGCSKDPAGGGAAAVPSGKGTVYAKGQDAPAGDVVHKILACERMDVIKASRALEDWKEDAEDMPAPQGKSWVYLKGQVTNKGKDEKSIKVICVMIADETGTEHSFATDTTYFASPPVSENVKPGATVEWAAYYEVPAASKKLHFVGTDLSFLGEARCKVGLD